MKGLTLPNCNSPRPFLVTNITDPAVPLLVMLPVKRVVAVWLIVRVDDPAALLSIVPVSPRRFPIHALFVFNRRNPPLMSRLLPMVNAP